MFRYLKILLIQKMNALNKCMTYKATLSSFSVPGYFCSTSKRPSIGFSEYEDSSHSIHAFCFIAIGGIPSVITQNGSRDWKNDTIGDNEQQMGFDFGWQGEKPSSLLPLGVPTSTLKASDGLILHQTQYFSHPGGFTKHDIFWWCLHALHYGHCSPSHQRAPPFLWGKYYKPAWRGE